MESDVQQTETASKGLNLEKTGVLWAGQQNKLRSGYDRNKK